MKTLSLFFTLAVMYFGWSLSAWETSDDYDDYGGESARAVPPMELLTMEGFPR